MQGDFSVLNFDPHEHERGVSPPAQGVLRNISGVLHQQGRVTTDADYTEGELLELGWNGQAGRDIIGAGVCAVPATEPQGFRVESALVDDGQVHVMLRPGRAWADGILTRLAGMASNPLAPVERVATYFGPPLSTPQPTPDQIDNGVRDAVILEVSEEALHGFQYPQRLIEPALGGPDTSERAFVNFRIRLLRLAADEDCNTILSRLRDDPSSKGRLTASLAPVVAIAGDCPVVGGGGYTGFEHQLYRIEIADVDAGDPARFKWSQWNGGLVGRGRFDTATDPDRVIIDAGRAAIVNSGLTGFYLEALEYIPLIGAWQVVYGTIATLNTDHDLELAAPASFGTLPSSPSVFFRLWNGIADILAFTNAANPAPLRDGIRLVFDAPAAGNYRPGDYWTFTVRAGEIFNPQVLIDDAPPTGIVYHRVPLAEINWTGDHNTTLSGTIEDCRKRFRPLTNQKICCTFLVGDGVSSFGDFNSLEEAALHLPAGGGELCLLPGLHRANLALDGRRNVTIHGCERRSFILPRTESRAQPILQFIDCEGIHVYGLDLVTFDAVAVHIVGRTEGSCRDIRIHDNRVIARTNVIRADNAAEVVIANNRLHLLDTVNGRATISAHVDDSLIERNTLVLMPFVDPTPNEPEIPDDDPTRDPADPCARPQILYQFPKLVLLYAFKVWAFSLALLVPRQPYRAIGGIHVRAGSERVRILENNIVGGAGNGITLGGDLDPADPVPAQALLPTPSLASSSGTVAVPSSAEGDVTPAVNVTAGGQFLALVQDEQGRPLENIDVYLESATTASDRSDAQGMASVKATPGAYMLDVSPAYRIVRVTEARDEGVLVNAITVLPRAVAATKGQGFLHELTIGNNDISMMGLSGIGFALRRGASVRAPAKTIPTGNPKAALLGFIDAAVLNLALAPLLRATHPVRDLVIRENRLHHNLRNPFTETMRAEAQVIGRGGVSLGICESVVIAGNHVYENGVSAIEPVCGVFCGYVNDAEITDNVLAANGAITADYEERRQAGLRGGFYIRFAGALTTQFSSSSGRKPAARVHDNRVDQPAGRALTMFAFGPVSVANNHFNSEFTGRFGLLDSLFGCVLLLNLGGIHRLLARTLSRYIDTRDKLGNSTTVGTTSPGAVSTTPSTGLSTGFSTNATLSPNAAFAGRVSFAARAEVALPGGETIFDDNYVRLGQVNHSLMSQMMVCFDDLGYSSNTASVFRGNPFFANAALIADTVRATASRFREEAGPTLSLWSHALRINTTALNQGDHCIVARQATTVTVPPRPAIVAGPNQVLDALRCNKDFEAQDSIGRSFIAMLAANAGELGGTLEQGSFTGAEVGTLARATTAKSMTAVNETQIVTNKAYAAEAHRLQGKLGAEHPKTVALQAQADAGAQSTRILATGAEAVTIEVPLVSEAGSVVSGRFVNERGQGLAGYTVELLRANGTRAELVGPTDGNGFFAANYDAKRTAELNKEGELFHRVLDAAGKEVLRDKTVIKIEAGAETQTVLSVPVRIVPKSVATEGTVIFGPKPPAPPPPPPSPPSPPAPQPPPAPAPVRTPLERLDIDDATRKLLINGGVRDVEAILETDPDKLASIVDSKDLAKKLIQMARQLLGSSPTAPTPTLRTDLAALGVDAALRKKLEAGGVPDVEAVLEVDPAKLVQIVGDRATAAKLTEAARKLLGGTPAPAPAPAGRAPGRKKTVSKKPK